jgi:hypothetical protein
VAKHDPALTQLSRLVVQTIASFGDDDATNRLITERVMPDALNIIGLRAEDMTRRIVSKLIGDRLKKPPTGLSEATPLLRGFELLSLPARIAVPALGVDPEEGSETVVWRAIHRCTLGDLKANIRMRDQLIEGQYAGRNTIHRVLEAGVAAGGSDDDVIGDLLGTVTPADAVAEAPGLNSPT